MTTSALVDGMRINSTLGLTPLSIIGSGPPLVVVHGGPGLEHTYFLPWLQELAQYRTLVFYDQFGSGEGAGVPASSITADVLVDQLVDIVSTISNGNRVGLFAHSFGTHIALQALTRVPDGSIHELVLCNPFALTADRFAASGERLMARIPTEVKTLIEQFEAEGTDEAGRKLMYAALPYYVASPNNIPPMHFGAYSMSVNAAVFGAIGDFDTTDAAAQLPPRTLLVYGKSDFLTPDDSRELRGKATNEIMVPDAGHFLFAEQPEIFLNALRGFFARPPEVR